MRAIPWVVAGVAMAMGATAEPADAKGARDRRAILEIARIPAEREIGRPIKFVVQRLKYSGNYAFLFADMQDAFGRPLDYSGTKLAQLQEQGFVSNAYAALLKRNGSGGWTVIVHDVGPTDVSWSGWSKQYGVPAALFTE